ncbi:hypothetical protein BV898_14249 [Hypsibius exemplaris]|uniref:G-protein coupled receptors family 1 profile domain-containing protein n=1 Tax=Hypsibius exemplaris TaxID=2072580 RepID=A0A1W0W8D6_HYPEX|nr:hypothetical protein BV898_14249 [Hypsibius exemplaris]
MNISLNGTDRLLNRTNGTLVSGSSAPSIAWYIVTGCLCCIGSLVNILLLAILIVNKRLRGRSGIIILHAVVIYLTICLIYIPLQLAQVRSFYSPSPFFIPNCWSFHYVYTLTTFLAYWTDAALAVNRFIALCFPFAYPFWSTKKVIVMTLLFCWLVCLGMTLPYLFGYEGQFQQSLRTGLCIYRSYRVGPGTPVYTMWSVAVYVPNAITGVVTVVISVKLGIAFRERRRNAVNVPLPRHQINGGPGPSSQSTQNRGPSSLSTQAGRLSGPTARTRGTRSTAATLSQRRLRNVKMLLVSFVWVLGGNLLPVSFFQLVQNLSAHWLRTNDILQYVLTPLTFFAMNSDYRTAARDLFGAL